MENRLQTILDFLRESVPIFAKKLDVTPELLYMVLSGKRNISKKLANKIQDSYGIPFRYSFEGVGDLIVDDNIIVKHNDNNVRVESETSGESAYHHLSIYEALLREKELRIKDKEKIIRDKEEIIDLLKDKLAIKSGSKEKDPHDSVGNI